jgi:uncharacterized repeat protein (TIGR04052 family)
MPTRIDFAAQYSGQPLSCATRANEPALTDLRLFVYDVELRTMDGAWRSLHLDSDDNWQQSGLAMVDLENGRGACLNGTSEMNAGITGRLPRDGYRGLRFVLGVPFDSNHADPLTAAAPLDDSAMHWHWRSGYKFLRAGLASGSDGFWIHLGSTGCEGTIGNITGCRQPNRVRVELDDFVPGESTVVFDFSALLEGTDLGDRAGSDCSSAPSETSCQAPFAALGLAFGSNSPAAVQRVFKPARQ